MIRTYASVPRHGQAKKERYRCRHYNRHFHRQQGEESSVLPSVKAAGGENQGACAQIFSLAGGIGERSLHIEA